MLGGGIKPPHNRLFVRGHDPRRNCFQEGFGQRFLQCDFFVEERVFQHGRNVLGQHHQILEVVIFEAVPGDAVAEEEPADDSASCMQRHDHFRTEGIESTPHQDPLSLIGCLRKIAPADEMGVELEPAHERIALAVFHFISFRQAAQAGPQTIAVALPDTGKNAYARDAGCIRDTFDNARKESLYVFKAAKNPREAQQRHRRSIAVRHQIQPPRRLGQRDEARVFAQLAVFLQNPQVIKGAGHEGLKTAAIELQIFGCVDARLLRLTQWFGAWSPKSRDEHLGPFLLNLIDEITRVFRPQIDQEKRGTALLKNGVQAIRVRHVPDLRDDSKERSDPPREVRILRVQNADGRSGHAAATSSSNRTSGSRI